MSLEEIKKQMTALDNRLTLVDAKIERILELVETDCKKMREHIDFVETVYDKVKSPFNYVMDRVSYLVNNDSISLSITNHHDTKEKEDETKEDKTKEDETKENNPKKKDQ